MNGRVVLGRYRILRRLAHGGMGSVYLGRTEGAEGFARPVVIKRVLPGLLEDREIAQMFVREARILANLHHPNIVGVLDFGQQADGSYLMVLDYVHGYQLAEWHSFVAATRGPIPVNFALHIMSKVLEALHYAHTFQRADGRVMKIVHRDVTPSNVLLNDQGTVKLLDFGIAKVTGDESAFFTERPQLKGKLPYLPLEAFQGVEPSVAGDVYSAALTLYEVLTGTNPFAGRDTADIYLKVLNVVPPALHSLRDDAPMELDAVVQRALHKDPAERFATAAEFAQALRALRSEAEDVVVTALTKQLSADFYGSMPEHLELEPLNSRELAWRGASVHPTAQPAEHDTHATVRPAGPADLEHVTQRANVSPSMLAAATSSMNPVPFEHDPSTLPPAPPASKRGPVVVVALAASIGALVALFAWSLLAPAPAVREQLVVIQRESAATTVATAHLEAKAAAHVEAPPDPQPTAAANAPVAESAAKEPSVKPPHETPAAVPDPKALSRVFGRRQAHVESCFHKYAVGVPALPQISLHFRVDAAGDVAEAVVSPPEVAPTELGRCLLDIARSTHFGALQHGVSFHIPISVEKIAAAGG
jgi:serine/threonine protein kinase